MIGFEIYINDEKPIIMASDHVVSVILGYGYPLGSTISLIGRDCSNDLTWLKGKPEIGDKIIIKVIETDEVSPCKKTKCDREWMIQQYEQLKIKLHPVLAGSDPCSRAGRGCKIRQCHVKRRKTRQKYGSYLHQHEKDQELLPWRKHLGIDGRVVLQIFRSVF